MNILFADDEVSITEQMVRLLSSFGHKVDAVSDGSAAFSCLRQREDYYDLLITDVQMADMDGITLLRRLTDLGINVPVVVVTGHGNMDTVIEAIRHQALDFVSKPFNRKQIERVLSRVQEANLDNHEQFDEWPYLSDEVKMTFKATTNIDALAVQRLQRYMSSTFKFHKVMVRPVLACVQEAIRNAVEHGSQEDDPIEITMRYEEGLEPAITISVKDTGNGFDFERVKAEAESSFTASEIRHKSIFLMLNTMTDIRWEDDGSKIVMVKKFTS